MDMYFEENYKVANDGNTVQSLQDDCLAAFGVAMMLSQLGA